MNTILYSLKRLYFHRKQQYSRRAIVGSMLPWAVIYHFHDRFDQFRGICAIWVIFDRTFGDSAAFSLFGPPIYANSVDNSRKVCVWSIITLRIGHLGHKLPNFDIHPHWIDKKMKYQQECAIINLGAWRLRCMCSGEGGHWTIFTQQHFCFSAYFGHHNTHHNQLCMLSLWTRSFSSWMSQWLWAEIYIM